MAINYPVAFKFDKSGLGSAESSLKKFGKIAGGVAVGATAAIAGIAAKGIKDFADFDAALNKSISIMGDVGETLQTEMADTAREVAKSTTFSAEQAAEAYFFLASAGLDAEQQISAMPQVAKFAQAGMFDMATATDLATDAQSALGLASDDAGENLDNLTRVTDVFVKANTLANTSVEQLASAITTKAGNALKTVGKDIEEGSAALAVFADQGIKGERAGTLLTNTLFGLTDNAEKNAGAFESLGIQVFDADGAMRNMADIADDVTGAFDGMSEEQKLAELSQLGFTKQTREGVLALAGNGDALREYEEALNSAGGTAEEVANKQLQTPTAQLDLFKSALEDASLEIGSGLTPVLGDLAAGLTPLVNNLTPAIGDLMEKITPRVEDASQAFQRFVELVSVDAGRVYILKNIKEDIDAFFNGGGLGDALLAFNEFRNDLIMGFLEALPGIIEGLTQALPGIISFITETLLPQLIDQFSKIVTELVNTFAEVMPMIIEGLATAIPQLVQAISDLIPTIISTLLELIPTLLEGALQFFTAMIDAFGQMIPQLITTISELIPQVIESIVAMLPQIITGALELFNGIITALVETIPLVIEAFIEAFPTVLTAIIESLPLIIEAALELFFGIVTGLLENVPKILTAIIEMIPEVTGQLIDMLPDIVEAAIDLFFGLTEGLIKATPELLGAIIELIPKITGALLDAAPQLLEAGFNILKGIAEGIFNNVTRIASDIASRIGGAVMNAINGFFGIRSPSRLMMGVGEDLLAGLEKGIKDSEDLAVGATLDMASNVKVASESAFDGVGSSPSFAAETSSASMLANAGQTNQNINIEVNAGAGTDPVSVGRAVVDAIKRYESTNGKVFAAA